MTSDIGAQRFSRAQTIAVLVVGIVGVLIPGLQPQLLGAMAIEGRADAVLVGHLATVEMLAMGIAAGGASFVLPIGRVRAIAAVALIAAAIADGLTTMLNGPMLLFARGGAGLAEGILIWIAIQLITRMANPARWSGVYLGAQTLAQFGVSTILAAWIIAPFGAAGGFLALAVITAMGSIAIVWLPSHFVPVLQPHQDHGARIPMRGFVGLTGVLLYLAAIVSVWVYVEPLAIERGVPLAMIAAIAPLSLAMQVVGAGLATLLAARLPALPAIALAVLAHLAVLTVMATATDPTIFLVATSLFGMAWLFAMPFHVTAIIAADRSLRAAGLIGGAQLLGSSIGPFVAAQLINGGHIAPIVWIAAACLLSGAVLILACAARAGRPATTA